MRSGVERCAALCGLGAVVTGLSLGCIDLFHSTAFDLCASSGDAPGCADSGGGGPDATLRDGGKDTGQDARGDSHVGVRDAGDAGAVGQDAHMHDAATGGDSGGTPDSGVDSAPPPMDAGTDFCARFTAAEAAASARKACLWLAACGSNADLNEYGKCYPLALQAYDCTLNPNQRVREGSLHTFWDGLWNAASCADVQKAILGANSAPCASSPVNGCGSPSDPTGGTGDLVVGCASSGGGYAKLVNCAMAGYTCGSGACTNSPVPCADAATGGCVGNSLHSCQQVEVEAGTATAYVDIGRDCTNFGGGACVTGGGLAGCSPNLTGGACDASTAVTCTGDATATGCATGHLETIQCNHFGYRSTCYPPSGTWAASSRELASACLNPTTAGVSPGCGGGVLTDNGGPCGKLEVDCSDAGFGTCANSGPSSPYCTGP